MANPIARQLADEVRAVFAEEAAELLRQIEVALNELSAAEGATRGALWLNVLRPLHTLKGAAAAAGEDAIKGDVHFLEDRVRRLEQGEASLDQSLVEELH